MKIISLKNEILQYEEESENWNRFLYKTSIGSDKATLMVRRFEYKILQDLTGVDVYEEYVENDFTINNLAIDNPFSNPEEIMCSLIQSNCIGKNNSLENSKFYENNYYQSLWKKSLRVDEYKLINDAVLESFKNFNSKKYFELADKLFDEDPDYNSLDCVVCMIYLTTVYSLKLKTL